MFNFKNTCILQFQKSRLNTEMRKFLRKFYNYWPSTASNGLHFIVYDSSKLYFSFSFHFLQAKCECEIILIQTISCIHCKIESIDNDVADIRQRNDRVVVQLRSIFMYTLYMSEFLPTQRT